MPSSQTPTTLHLQPGKNVLCPASSLPSNKVEYVYDSGAGYHRRGRDSLTEEQRAQIKPLQEPMTINTANGVITISECIELQLLELGGARTLTFVVLDDSPNLLSASKLALEEGYRF